MKLKRSKAFSVLCCVVILCAYLLPCASARTQGLQSTCCAVKDFLAVEIYFLYRLVR